MKSLKQLLVDYGAYHTQRATFFTHLVGVPLVVFSLMIFLSWIEISVKPFFEFSLLWPLIIALGFYYVRLDWQIGLSVFVGFCMLASLACVLSQGGFNRVSGFVFLIAFVGGWIIQFIGHIFEGRRPALFDNLSQVFTAPLFVVVEGLLLLGFRKDLRGS